jgi:prephenate dehydrogenase
VVSDVASTKTQVLEWARELLPSTIEFIGGHPMAGKEQSGAAAADPNLFKDAIYCLTPSPRARQSAINLVETMVAQIHAKVYYIDAAEHDAYVAGISHLPFMLSTALIDLVSRSPAWKEMAPLAATGFRDISRLASGDALMHRDICMTNRDALARWLEETAQWLLDARDLIEAGEADQLLDLFTRARAAREAWLISRPNLRPGEDAFENIGGVTPERPSLFGKLGKRR